MMLPVSYITLAIAEKTLPVILDGIPAEVNAEDIIFVDTQNDAPDSTDILGLSCKYIEGAIPQEPKLYCSFYVKSKIIPSEISAVLSPKVLIQREGLHDFVIKNIGNEGLTDGKITYTCAVNRGGCSFLRSVEFSSLAVNEHRRIHAQDYGKSTLTFTQYHSESGGSVEIKNAQRVEITPNTQQKKSNTDLYICDGPTQSERTQFEKDLVLPLQSAALHYFSEDNCDSRDHDNDPFVLSGGTEEVHGSIDVPSHYLYAAEDYAWLSVTKTLMSIKRNPTPLNNRTPLILIHGWQGGFDEDTPIEWHENASSGEAYFENFLCFLGNINVNQSCEGYTDKSATDLLENYKPYIFHYPSFKRITYNARMLGDLVNKTPELKQHISSGGKIAIVSHSMGGLVARSLIEEHGNINGIDSDQWLDKLITLATPHHGSPAAVQEWVDIGDWVANKSRRTPGAMDLMWDNYDSAIEKKKFDLLSEDWLKQRRNPFALNTINSSFDEFYQPQEIEDGKISTISNPWLHNLNKRNRARNKRYYLYAGFIVLDPLAQVAFQGLADVIRNTEKFGAAAQSVVRNSDYYNDAVVPDVSGFYQELSLSEYQPFFKPESFDGQLIQIVEDNTTHLRAFRDMDHDLFRTGIAGHFNVAKVTKGRKLRSPLEIHQIFIGSLYGGVGFSQFPVIDKVNQKTYDPLFMTVAFDLGYNSEPDNVSTGIITAPAEGSNQTGTVDITFNASDLDGLAKVSLVFTSNGKPFIVCEDGAIVEGCVGNSVTQTVTLNPADYGAQPGNVSIGLWLTDESGQSTQIDSLAFNWIGDSAGIIIQKNVIYADDPSENLQFGSKVGISGDAAYALSEKSNTLYIFERLLGAWSKTNKITPTNPKNKLSSADIELHNNVIAILFPPYIQEKKPRIYRQDLHIYELNNGIWELDTIPLSGASINAENRAMSLYNNRIALSFYNHNHCCSDGSATIKTWGKIEGSWKKYDDNLSTCTGAKSSNQVGNNLIFHCRKGQGPRVYKRVGSSWELTGSISGPPRVNVWFDYETLLYNEDTLLLTVDRHSTYEYNLIDSKWVYQSPIANISHYSGSSPTWPSVTGNGELIAIDHLHKSSGVKKINVLIPGSDSWKVLDSIDFENPSSMDVDGNTVMVGAQLDSSSGISRAGAVYFFEVASESNDVATGITTRISVASNGVEANDQSESPAISGNGQFVAFGSRASNLFNDDTNGYKDVFVHGRLARSTKPVSSAFDGTQANGASHNISINKNGDIVAFSSDANNLGMN